MHGKAQLQPPPSLSAGSARAKIQVSLIQFSMAGTNSVKALILTADGFDDLEMFYPWYRLREEGIEVTVAAPGGHVVTGQHGYKLEPDTPVRELNPGEYDLLVIPGGAAPEKLRLREEAVDVARTFMDEDRRVAVIGRGIQLLISASALSGRRATCAAALRDDLRAAGGSYHDEAVVSDGNLLSCRGCDDLPAFGRQLLALLGARA
jgi:protease I